jgi:hypothetical protein
MAAPFYVHGSEATWALPRDAITRILADANVTNDKSNELERKQTEAASDAVRVSPDSGLLYVSDGGCTSYPLDCLAEVMEDDSRREKAADSKLVKRLSGIDTLRSSVLHEPDVMFSRRRLTKWLSMQNVQSKHNLQWPSHLAAQGGKIGVHSQRKPFTVTIQLDHNIAGATNEATCSCTGTDTVTDLVARAVADFHSAKALASAGECSSV